MKLPWVTKRQLAREHRHLEAELSSERELRRQIQRDLHETIDKLRERNIIISQLKTYETAVGSMQRILMTAPYDR